jgi:hypothetical protein
LTGEVRQTFVRGRLVFDADAGPSEPGGARVVTPAPT